MTGTDASKRPGDQALLANFRPGLWRVVRLQLGLVVEGRDQRKVV
jgi:hypothetical protein